MRLSNVEMVATNKFYWTKTRVAGLHVRVDNVCGLFCANVAQNGCDSQVPTVRTPQKDTRILCMSTTCLQPSLRCPTEDIHRANRSLLRSQISPADHIYSPDCRLAVAAGSAREADQAVARHPILLPLKHTVASNVAFGIIFQVYALHIKLFLYNRFSYDV